MIAIPVKRAIEMRIAISSASARIVLFCLSVVLTNQVIQSQQTPSSFPPPTDAKVARLYAKALKDSQDRRYAAALDGFRKADQQGRDSCVSCERQAYAAALQLQDYRTTHEEAVLLLKHVTDPATQAEIHSLIGDACLGEGGNKIFEQPFVDADKEFQAALVLEPGNADCLYKDGLALSHLHQYTKAQERFEEYLKTAPPAGVQYARARLFSKQPELARKRIAPGFNVISSGGTPISMEKLAGKVVLIDFWATWCGPCKQALPHMKEIVKQFEGQPLVVISISVDNDETTWKTFVETNGMTWLQYRDGSFDGPISSAFGVKAIPTTFSIDADGFVQDQQVGEGKIEEKLKKLLAQAAASAGQKTASQAEPAGPQSHPSVLLAGSPFAIDSDSAVR